MSLFLQVFPLCIGEKSWLNEAKISRVEWIVAHVICNLNINGPCGGADWGRVFGRADVYCHVMSCHSLRYVSRVE
jgi:hypothetical protein